MEETIFGPLRRSENDAVLSVGPFSPTAFLGPLWQSWWRNDDASFSSMTRPQDGYTYRRAVASTIFHSVRPVFPPSKKSWYLFPHVMFFILRQKRHLQREENDVECKSALIRRQHHQHPIASSSAHSFRLFWRSKGSKKGGKEREAPKIALPCTYIQSQETVALHIQHNFFPADFPHERHSGTYCAVPRALKCCSNIFSCRVTVSTEEGRNCARKGRERTYT